MRKLRWSAMVENNEHVKRGVTCHQEVSCKTGRWRWRYSKEVTYDLWKWSTESDGGLQVGSSL